MTHPGAPIPSTPDQTKLRWDAAVFEHLMDDRETAERLRHQADAIQHWCRENSWAAGEWSNPELGWP